MFGVVLLFLSIHSVLFQRVGRKSEIEPYYRRALAIREQMLGENHPDTLAMATALANLLQDEGKKQEAEGLYRRAMESRENTLGSKNPDVLNSITNLAMLLKSEVCDSLLSLIDGIRCSRLRCDELFRKSLTKPRTCIAVRYRSARRSMVQSISRLSTP